MSEHATPTLEGGETGLQDLVDAYIRSVATAEGDGTYATNARRILEKWVDEWCEPRSYETVGDLDKHKLADYAAHLKRRVGGGGISDHTANAYYDVISACLGYAVRRDLLDTNPARKEAAEQELPEATSKQTRQYWSRETRELLVRWTDWRAETALDDGWMDGEAAVRDRAFVAVIGFTGARGSEVLRDPRDSRRDGIRWRDVDLADQTMEVLGKPQERQHIYIPEQAIRFIEAHRRRQDPPTDDWPLFPTGHLPSLYDHARGELAADVDDLESRLTPDGVGDLLREHEIAPPAMTTEGGRTILERLSAESGITQDGEYPKPHGGRRGLGRELYLESPELAQETLRHENLETTQQSYAEVDAVERGETIDDVLD